MNGLATIEPTESKEVTSYERWRTSLFGRKCKLTPKTKRKILFFARQGHKDVTIMKLVNISPTSFYKYLNQYKDFANEFERAREASIQRKVQGIEKAGKHDWKALSWLLSKQAREDYGDYRDINLKTQTTTRVYVTSSGYQAPEDIEAREKRIKADNAVISEADGVAIIDATLVNPQE